jgi:catechol 2,3-dioxygenase-like lactoylglutathione lyase family enzyme
MIFGSHILLFSSDADADRAFVRDVLGFRAIDVGGGWLIFELPPAEAAVHPGSQMAEVQHAEHRLLGAALYLICDDVRAEVERLQARRVPCSPIEEEPWGLRTTIRLPSGGEIGLYQPTHELALKRGG